MSGLLKLDYLQGPLQTKPFYDSMILLFSFYLEAATFFWFCFIPPRRNEKNIFLLFVEFHVSSVNFTLVLCINFINTDGLLASASQKIIIIKKKSLSIHL